MEYKYCLKVLKNNYENKLFFYEFFPSDKGNRKIILDNLVKGENIFLKRRNHKKIISL
jgi:hypothetical protein